MYIEDCMCLCLFVCVDVEWGGQGPVEIKCYMMNKKRGIWLFSVLKSAVIQG
jgi:hypothetical protein